MVILKNSCCYFFLFGSISCGFQILIHVNYLLAYPPNFHSFPWVKSQEIFLLYFLQEVTKISGAQKNNHLNLSLLILIPLLTGRSCRSNATITSTPPSPQHRMWQIIPQRLENIILRHFQIQPVSKPVREVRDIS